MYSPDFISAVSKGVSHKSGLDGVQQTWWVLKAVSVGQTPDKISDFENSHFVNSLFPFTKMVILVITHFGLNLVH